MERRVIKKPAHNVTATDPIWAEIICEIMYYKVERACKKMRSPDEPQEEKQKHHRKLLSLASPDNHCILWDGGSYGDRRGEGYRVERKMEKSPNNISLWKNISLWSGQETQTAYSLGANQQAPQN